MLACRIHAKDDLRVEPQDMPEVGPGEPEHSRAPVLTGKAKRQGRVAAERAEDQRCGNPVDGPQRHADVAEGAGESVQ